MKVQPSMGNLSALGSKGAPLSTPIQGGRFEQVLQAKLDGLSQLLGGDANQLQKIEAGIMRGQKLSAPELLVYQIKAGQFGLRVELVSKLAESLAGSWRRLQSG